MVATLDTEIARLLLTGQIPVEPLTPEAGPRRYFRSLDPKVQGWLWVKSEAPPPLATTSWLGQLGIRVPRIGANTAEAYLVEDLGDRHLHQVQDLSYEEELLGDLRILAGNELPEDHPNRQWSLDKQLFCKELRIFREWYVQAFRKRAWSPAQATEIDGVCEDLATQAARKPWTVQHRDMHCRNVLVCPDGKTAWIDHQDLRPGPVFYDLASLKTDAYRNLHPRTEQRLQQEIEAIGELHGWNAGNTQERFQTTALQRVLKALGTFGRLLVTGRTDYKNAEIRARRYAVQMLRNHARYRVLHKWVH